MGLVHLRMMLLSRISFVSFLCFFFSFIFVYVLALLGAPIDGTAPIVLQWGGCAAALF